MGKAMTDRELIPDAKIRVVRTARKELPSSEMRLSWEGAIDSDSARVVSLEDA